MKSLRVLLFVWVVLASGRARELSAQAPDHVALHLDQFRANHAQKQSLTKKWANLEDEVDAATAVSVDLWKKVSLLEFKIIEADNAHIKATNESRNKDNDKNKSNANKSGGFKIVRDQLILERQELVKLARRSDLTIKSLNGEFNGLRNRAANVQASLIYLADPFGRLSREEAAAAIELCTEWLDDDPKDTEVLAARACSRMGTKEFDQALADLDRLDALEGKFATQAARGYIHFLQGAKLEAETAFLFAKDANAKQKPVDVSSSLFRGAAYFATGDYSKAEKELRSVIRDRAGMVEAHRLLAWIYASSPDPQQRDTKRALSEAKAACKHAGKKDGACQETVAAAHAEAGEWDLAIEAQEAAIELCLGEKRDAARDRLRLYKDHKPFRMDKH